MNHILGFMEKIDENVGILLGRRIRSLRTARKLTQQELGEEADINYKFLGESERGQQNPSFQVLVKIAAALEVELPELFRLEPEITDRKDVLNRIGKIINSLNDENLRQVLLLLRVLYPTQ
jgi:transcriptional regulator with XRE-family HTH domain